MKKITLVLLTVLASSNFYFGQANLIVQAPLDNTSTQVRAPNGLSSSAYLNACALVLQTELTGIPNNSTLSLFGFTLATTSTVTIPVTGNFTVYLQNTTDITYLKGTTWSTIPTGMTSVYASVMTVPLSSTTTSVVLTLSTPFIYTGGGLYVAYEWVSTGPFSTSPATYLADGGANLNPGCASAASAVSAPTTLGTTAFRPSFLFGFTNPYSNDVQIIGLEAPGNIPLILNTAHIVKALVKNASNTGLTSIPVSLNVSGANPSTNTQIISSLAAGSSTLITFPALNPSLPGLQTVSVSVPSDQNNVNNSSNYAQKVSCNFWSQNPAAGTFTSNAVGFGAGSGILATPFLNPVTSTITGIRGAISSGATNVGNNVYAVLMNATGGILATTNTLTISTGMLSSFQQFDFNVPQNLSPATTYYLGLAQIVPGNAVAYYPAGTLASLYLPGNLYFSALITGGVLTPVTQNFGYFGLEAVLGHTANISVVSTPTAICNGTCATIGAQGTTSYTWSTGSTGTSIAVCPSVTTTYFIIGSNAIGCNSSAAITLTVNQLPNLIASSNATAICLGGSVTLNSSGAATYSWNTGPTTSSIVQSPAVTSTYTITGTSAAGCVSTKTLEVIVNSFTPGITSPASICQGQSINLTASGGSLYAWVGIPSPFAMVTVSPGITTSYTVSATGSNGCSGSTTTTVTVNTNPTVTASAQRTVMCKGESNTITALGATNYTWSNNASGGTVTISPTSNITFNYIVTGSNSAGCTHTAEVSVKVNLCSSLAENNASLFGATIFPNPSTGVLTVHLESVPENVHIKIYNAIGALVKEQSLASVDNLINIQDQQNGLYFIHVIHNNTTLYNSKIIKQ
jgi:hypothetical protein